MANPTTNYGFIMPTPTDLVTDLPADFGVFGQAVDTQMKTNADAAINKTIVDAKGDIIAATAADTVARLAVGANDTVLTADSTTATGLKWATSSSGAYTQIATGSLGTGASLTISSIPTTYQDLVLVVSGYFPSTAANRIDFYLNGDTASKYRTAIPAVAFSDVNIDTAYTNIRLGANMANTGATNNRAIVSFPQYSQTVGIKRFYIDAIFKADGATTSWSNGYSSGLYDSTAAISSITLIPSAGNIGGGNYTLYGVK